MFKKCAFRLAVCLCLIPGAALAEPLQALPTPLESALETLPQSCPSMLQGLKPEALKRLTEFYQATHHQPVWHSYAQLESLFQQLALLADDGLDPAHYQPERIREQLYQVSATPLHRECGDILTSHSYLEALHHLARGRLRQADVEPIWRSPEAPERDDAQQLLQIAVQGVADLPTAFDRARPAHALYRDLRAAYAALRQAPKPAWRPLPAGPTLRAGMSDERVPLLRELLLAGAGSTPLMDLRYDDELIEAVKGFQLQHGLEDDGIVGAGTLAALNVSPASRLDQLRINLERMRWITRDLEPQSLLVDIAGARLIYMRDSCPFWQTRTQVGREARQTPPLKSQITRLTLNPTWTVPPTILQQDKLPLIRQDISYLARHQMRVIDAQGNSLDPHQVDWNNPRGIMLRQDAGPSNPLGQVAIRFANPFSVYLHDTPSKPLFNRAARALSSGCVRVEAALQLVDLLLAEGDREAVATLLQTGKTHEYRLTRPTPILIAYWTADTDDNGWPRYHPDIYKRDAALLRALNTAG
ncbi:murein L,D-transpeptidase [Stutzerimonas stutzeri]|uniref:Murein L,D-transpeptidase n=1 Tax=Stutzerimonas stutzeri TaxID=316 RepID=A0A2S4AQC8_STUST|nr:L,D-transpeptidase family protein [Stutzerimonas stutzeri]MCQ4263357.1 L,D-transpeptidase family protein [Stutzerimonas stutzeri]POH83237.1 murein L,D-transpeptidase [Stutzerimonas stutzeri]